MEMYDTEERDSPEHLLTPCELHKVATTTDCDHKRD
jgi:hypothetical protein